MNPAKEMEYKIALKPSTAAISALKVPQSTPDPPKNCVRSPFFPPYLTLYFGHNSQGQLFQDLQVFNLHSILRASTKPPPEHWPGHLSRLI